MELRIDSLEIENFKGIRSKRIEFGSETNIYGQNASGKSSIVDAFFWLLFDKDSRGNASGSDKFHEKPLDKQGREIHNVETSVTANCKLDNKPFTLKRVQKENWVKKRGAVEAVYQGNTSSYWINGVETKAADYRERISKLANGDVFQLITTLGAFNAMDWKKRRAVLMSMHDSDVEARLMKDESFSRIVKEAEERGVAIDDLKKVLQDRRKLLNKELAEYPARIDEARRAIPNVTETDVADAEYNIKDATEDLNRVEQMLNGMGADGGSNILMEISTLERELVREKRAQDDAMQSAKQAAINGVDEALKLKSRRESDLAYAVSQCKANETTITLLDGKLKDLRSRYKAEYERAFDEPKVETICPACGQPIPQERQDEVRLEAKKQFEASKRKALDEINNQGQKAKAELNEARERGAVLDQRKAEAEAELKGAEEKCAGAQKTMTEVLSRPLEDSERVKELKARIDELKLKAVQTPDGQTKELEDRKAQIQERISKNQKVIQSAEIAKAMQGRVKELETNQRVCGERVAEVELMIGDVERFVMSRSRMLEDSINDLFPTVRWKLFDTQINGGVTDCCECMILCDGCTVPYSGANTASCVNADIEIIGVLEKHFDLTVPVFVDNAERVNHLTRPHGQLITLSVSDDLELRVETQTEREAA